MDPESLCQPPARAKRLTFELTGKLDHVDKRVRLPKIKAHALQNHPLKPDYSSPLLIKRLIVSLPACQTWEASFEPATPRLSTTYRRGGIRNVTARVPNDESRHHDIADFLGRVFHFAGNKQTSCTDILHALRQPTPRCASLRESHRVGEVCYRIRQMKPVIQNHRRCCRSHRAARQDQCAHTKKGRLQSQLVCHCV